MQLQQRIDLLVRLGEYMQNDNNEFRLVKEKAHLENPWFVPEFIDLSIKNICEHFLQKNKLEAWTASYNLIQQNNAKSVGIVMAGNIPLVGFHDLLCVFITGNVALIKPSSKDSVLINHLVQKLIEWESSVADYISFAEILKGCNAYIATGSNNSGRYFDYYFGKFPSIIRKNRTSVAILNGNEPQETLEKLADDIQLYFGLGCRNVTKLFLPKNYDFTGLLNAVKKYDRFMEFHKYKHNYDYQLALLLMNNKLYMTDGSLIFTENDSVFSPVSQVNYSFYDDANKLRDSLKENENIQCIVSALDLSFGKTQSPSLTDYADSIDTMKFLITL